MLLNELLIKIGVKTDLSKLQKVNVELKNIGKATALIGAAFAGAMAGIAAFTSANLTALDEVRQLSKVTGEAAEQIHLLGKVAEVNGSSSQAAQASIANLSKTIGEAANGIGLGAKAFEKYGLSAKKSNGEIKTSSEMLEEIRAKIQGMSNQQQIAMLSKLGIDGSMIQTLRLTNAEMQEALETAQALSLGVANAENAEIAAGFKDSMTEFSQMMTGIREFLALKFAPAIMDVIGRFKQWFIINNALIKEGLSEFADKIKRGLKFVGSFISAIDRVIRATVGWKNAMYILAAVSLWLNRQMIKSFMMNPFTWIVMGLVALIALIEDFIIYLEDGAEASALGEFWQPFAKGLRWVQGLIAKFPQYWAKALAFWNEYKAELVLGIGLIVALFGNGIASMASQFSGFTRLFGAVNKVSGFFSTLIGWGGKLTAAIGKIGMAIKEAFIANPVGLVIAAVAVLAYVIYKNIDKIKKYFSDGWKAIKARWQAFLDAFSINPLAAIFDAVIDIIKLPFKVAFDAILGLWNFFTGSQLDLSVIEKGFAKVTNWIMQPFKSAFDWVKAQYDRFIQPIIDTVSNFSPSKIADDISGGLKSGWDKMTSFFSSDDEQASQNKAAQLSQIAQAPMQAAILPAQSAVQNSADHSVKNSNNKYTTTINLNGSSNSAQDAKIIADRVQQAHFNTASAVGI